MLHLHSNPSATASNNRVQTLLKAGAFLTTTLCTSAHNIDSESLYAHSFASIPYDLTAPMRVAYNQVEEAWDVDASGSDTLQSSATTSRAIFARLERNEVDIYTALISPSDQSDHEKWLEALEGAGQAPGLAEVMVERHLTAVVASPLPPACAHTKNDPSIALAIPISLATGPKFPGDPFAMSCVTNESVPGYTPRPGHCIVSIQHNIETGSRVTFNEPHTGASWFLPTGCILSNRGFPICNGDYDQNGIPENRPAPGIFTLLPNSLPAVAFPDQADGFDVEIVVWDRTGRAMDYTLNSGFREDVDGAGKDNSVVAHDHELEEAVANNGWINDFRGGCGPVQ